MQCPDCTNGDGCATCGGDGTVPDWLANDAVNGTAAADTWRED